MSHQKIWNFWASRYKRLWVQTVSLGPTRKAVISKIEERFNGSIGAYLDVGCGVGELVEAIELNFQTKESLGLDYAPKMIEYASRLKTKTHWYCEDISLFELNKPVDLIVCTHSFPYYKNQEVILKKFHSMIKKEGRLLIAFASKNSFYDKLCMAIVKLTTGKAKYPSIKAFKDMTKGEFRMLSTMRIKEKWYMPSIVLFEMEPIHE